MVWIAIATAFLILLVFFVYLMRRKKTKEGIDYYNMFVIGITWTGAGIPIMITTQMPALFVMGLVFMAVGIIHKKEWKKNIKDRKSRRESMTQKEKKFTLWVTVLLGILLLVLITYALFRVGYFG